MFASKTFHKMAPYGRTTAAIWLLIGTMLASPLALAQTQVQNTARVDSTDGTTDPNTPNNVSTVTNDVYAVTVAKSANPASGASVRVGGTISYTLTVTATGATTTSPATFTDTLSAGLALVAGSLPSQCTASGQTITCTLPAGSAIGTYTFAYQATVVSSASGSVSNSVTGGNGCTTSGGCTTTHTALPAAATSKTANTAGPVKVGDTITYTLSTEVLDTALVSAYPLTDTLGTGLTFGSVTSAGAYTCNASGNVLSCTLPAGTAPGTYVATYTATVNDQATGTVSNAVVSDGCTSGCAVVVPVQDPVMSTRKTADTAGPVSVGDTITYTLTTDVSNSRLTVAYPLTDTLGTGLTFGSVTNAGAYTCSASGNVLSCTLPIGTVPGSYAVTYTATVNNQALSTTGVTNSVSSTGCTGDCDVVTPVEAPATSTRKTANTAGPVSVGDTITYTLTTDVSNSQLIAAYPLTDTLGAGLTFGSVTSTGGHTCSSSGNVLSCTLPAGTVPGTYAVTYTATVNNQAVDRVRNTVSGTGCTNGCDVLIPVNGATSTRKTADTAGPVKVGDTITYTLTTVVSNTRLTAAYPLTDTLGTGLTFGSVTNAGAYSCSASGNVLNCTLPSGTLPGTYVATYTATVNSQATSATGVSNAVVSAGCTSECDVVTPVQAPATSTRKTADTAGPVKVGDTITYTLTTDVSNSALVADYPLTDMLDTGLTFGSVTSAGGHTCSASGNVLNCTLPSGTAAGTYAVTYTATVNNQAADFVRNTVTGAGCTSDCDIIIPTEAAAATTRKTADTAGPVAVGDTITYTLTTVVANGALTATYPVTDTLGTGLTFGAVTSAGGHTCSASGNVLSCTLPTGTAPGTYAVRYTTTVNSQASGSVTNAFTAPGCISDCEVIIPVGNARTAKIADTTGPVTVGDTITYTLTTVVSGSALTATYPVTDTLGTGLTFGAVTSAGDHTCSASGNVLNCTLPAGTAPGTYAVTYTATVNSQASGSVTNMFTAPGCISNCEVIIPVDGVSTAKTADTTGPVALGDTITYTLTTVVSGSALTATYPVTDTLGTGLTFGAVTSAGGHTCSASGSVLSCTLPAGTAPGTYAVSYTATVNSQASGSVTNTFTAPGCIIDCEVIIPVGNASTDKTADTTGPVAVGDTITYTLTTVVSGNALTATYPVTDTLGTGLTFGAVTSAGGHTCSASGNVLSCTLPAGTAAGTYAVTYTATVNSQASGSVTNTFTAPGCISDCEVIIPVEGVSTAKTANTIGPVAVGDTITYTLTTVVSGSALTATYPVTDTLGTGLTFGAVTSAGGHTCSASGNVLSCTLPAGTAPGTYAVTYTATVNSQASGSVTNTFTAPGCISDCEVLIPVEGVSTAKTADTTGPVTVGDTITYTLTTVVSGNALTTTYPVTDTLGTGLTFGAVTSAGGHTCSASGNVLSCTLPAGTAPGTYAVTYTATVNSQASGSVTNTFTAPGCISNCEVIIPVGNARTDKTADTTGPVAVGDTITYTLTTVVSNSALTATYPVTDTLGTGLTFGAVTSAGGHTCAVSGNVLNCTLPAGTAPGTYAVTYTATVNSQASGSVTNTFTAPGCIIDCEVIIPVGNARTAKTANTTGPVAVGDTITYTLTTVVSNSALTATYPVTDTLGTGLTFGSVTSAGGHSCAVSGNVLSCTLPAGTTPGTYAVTYTATVNSQASGSVTNTFTAPGCISDCEVIIPVGNARTVKTADTAGPVTVGNTITYTLTTVVSNAALTAAYPITDTLGTGLTFGAVTSAGGHTCSASGNVLNCTLPAGTAPGTYAVTYTATVNSQASGSVTNRFTAPGCISDCGVIIPLADQRVTYRKAADTAGPVKPDDTITYTLTMEVSGSRLTAAYTLTDTLGTGLTFGAVTSTGAYTCGTSGSVLTCTLPAGTAPGTYAVTYTATVNAQAGDSVSNAVTATGPVQPVCVGECTVDIDVTAPVRVTKVAGVSEAKVGDLVRYAVTVENNGTIDVVNGYAVDIPPAGFTYVEGSLRVSGADTQVMVSGQSPLRFDGIDVPVGQSATLTYLMRVGAGVRQGVQVNQVRVYSEQGQPISNVATAEVTVTGDPLLDDSLIFGTVFNDRNGDGWQDNDEPGIPGVRIASVDGLLIETDPFGRYHLAGVAGGAWERGRNFILKVDPSTLPAGTEFTTDNPLLRRITPGVPVRFDWGVKLLEQVIEGGTRQDELALGEVIYLPGSAELRSEYLPTIEKMAAKVREYGGGEVVIQANGQTERFALARAEAVRDALLPLLDPATAKAVTVSVRGIVDDPGSLWVGVDGDGVTLGTVLFDTDKSAIRPEFKPMLEQVANRLERMGGGSIAIIGHTDIRASHAYNTALGMRRAKAVYEALTQRLSPEVRSKVRVEAIDDPKAPVKANHE